MSSPTVIISAEQAQRLVEEYNNQFGLGALPALEVAETEDGAWRIVWADNEVRHKPMTVGQWRHWLDRRFGPGLLQRLETSEG